MSIGPWQVVLILAVIVLLFGAGKIPRLMGDVAKGIKAFKSGIREDDESGKQDAVEDKAQSATTSRESKEDTVKS